MTKDNEVYEFMVAYQDGYHKPPKMDEIRNAVEGLNYRSSVRQALVRLEREGLVENKEENKMRCWRVVQ